MRRRRGRATANETSSVRRFVMDRGESRVRVMVRVGGGDVLRPARKRRKDPEVFENRAGRGRRPLVSLLRLLSLRRIVLLVVGGPARGRLREVGAREETRSGQSGERRSSRALESRTRGGGGGVSRASRCARVRSMVLGLGSGTAAPAPVLKTVQGEGDSGFWKLMIRLRRGRCCLRCARPEARFSKTSTLRCHHDEKSRTTTPRRPTSVASRAGPV